MGRDLDSQCLGLVLYTWDFDLTIKYKMVVISTKSIELLYLP